MLIKHPSSDSPRRALGGLIKKVEEHVDFCKRHVYGNDECFSLLYLSTYTVTMAASLPGVGSFVEAIARLADREPERVVCVFRAPTFLLFRGRMYQLQKAALSVIRKSRCHLVLYDGKNDGLVNHAKFAVVFNVQRGREVCVYKYFGSTNFTASGIGGGIRGEGVGSVGNYEVYDIERHIIGGLVGGPWAGFSEGRLLAEIRDALDHLLRMYADNAYRRELVSRHISVLESLVGRPRDYDYLYSLGELYLLLIEANLSLIRTLSFISSLPGWTRFSHYIEDALGEIELIPPHELEMMVPDSERSAAEMARSLGYDVRYLRREVTRMRESIGYLIRRVLAWYMEATESRHLLRNMSEEEREYWEYVSAYGERHMIMVGLLRGSLG